MQDRGTQRASEIGEHGDAKRIEYPPEPLPAPGPREAALHPLRRFIEPLVRADERFRAAGLGPDDAAAPPDVPERWFVELIGLLDAAAEALAGLGDAHGAAALRAFRQVAEERPEVPADRAKLMDYLVFELGSFLMDGPAERPMPSKTRKTGPPAVRPWSLTPIRPPEDTEDVPDPLRPPDQAAVVGIAAMANRVLGYAVKSKTNVGRAADYLNGEATKCIDQLDHLLWEIGCLRGMDHRHRVKVRDSLLAGLPVPDGPAMVAYAQRIEREGFDPADNSAEAEYYRRTQQAGALFRLRSAHDELGGDEGAAAVQAFEIAAQELATLVRRPDDSAAETAEEENGKGQKKKSKKSTGKGEAREKIIAALALHHEYDDNDADGLCGNCASVGVRELGRLAEVSHQSASDFFNAEFETGRFGYRALCRRPEDLAAWIRRLRGETGSHRNVDPQSIRGNRRDRRRLKPVKDA
ncbi:MAG: hypothetical protein WD069_04325 [Planctomycetales bacterium]